MRPTQKPNRSRGRGNRKQNGNSANRVYDSSGPEGKVRGTPQQIIDKYLTLARDAQTSGDRVTAENFLQHAEHYQRILILSAGPQQERRDGQGGNDSDGDNDGDGEGEQFQASNGRQPPAAQPAEQTNGAPSGGTGERTPAAAPQGMDTVGEDSPLTTIGGTDTTGESLLVGEHEVEASQPTRRRRGRPRKSESQGEDAPSAQIDGNAVAKTAQAETASAPSDEPRGLRTAADGS